MNNGFDIAGKVAVVTGASGGIGSYIATLLASRAAVVGALGRNRDKLDLVVDGIVKAGGKAQGFVLDITDESAVNAAFHAIQGQLGPIDILVNCAGVSSRKLIIDLDAAEWDRVFDTNCRGTFLCTKAVAPSMIERRGGRIINIASTMAERSVMSRPAYSSSKAAVRNFTRAAAIELGSYGITVNCIGPTTIVTDITRESMRTQPEVFDAIVRRTPLGRIGEFEDLAGAVLLFASDASAFISGQMLYVDGGYTAS